MKYIAIIVIILCLVSCVVIIFQPNEPSSENKTLINQRDEALLQAKRLQAQYDLTAVILHKKEAELLESRRRVERSEKALEKAKQNEKVYLIRIKEQTRLMSDVEADSVIKRRYQSDPDSISQKVVVDLAKGDQCDSVRSHQDSVLSALRHQVVSQDSVSTLQQVLLKDSRDQVLNLNQALAVDDHFIKIQTKENKSLRKQGNFLKGGLLAAIIYGLIKSFD